MPQVGFQGVLVATLVCLLALFVATMCFEKTEQFVGRLFGLSRKNEILTFLGIGMGGVLVALQALVSYRRAKAMEDVAGEQARSNENSERGQRQERFRDAIEHLGHASDSVRLAGAYELFHLARDTEALRETVFEILCAHIRRTTRAREYQEGHGSKPSEEIQSLLTLLFVKDHDVFYGFIADLRESYLDGARLDDARLAYAELGSVRLNGASLPGARLISAILSDAQLKGAYIVRAELQDAFLRNAQLQGANIGVTQMQGADLCDAQLQGANLARVQMQGTNLIGVQLQAAHFLETQMQGARCEDLEDLSVSRVLQLAGQDSDFSALTFRGGLTQESAQLLVDGLPNGEAEKLRTKLEKHINVPESRRRPKGVVVGSYTEDEAKKWVAEYE